MAQSIGIHLGERRFHLVALDGNLKKHKVVCGVSGDIPPGESGADETVARLRELVKEHKLSADTVFLACDSGLAAYRNLTLPFDDRDKIEEVIKFEVESNLPQYDIDQVVVDFHVLSSKPGVESNLLVTAVPKERLARVLSICERAGLEPQETELEGTALFDAALEGGVLVEEQATVLLHVGDTSTTVAVADGLRLAALRAIRVGAFQAPIEAPAPVEGEAPAPPPVEDPEQLARRGLEAAQRIRRELGRTLSGVRTQHEIKRVYVGGNPLPGLADEALLDVPVEPLAILPGDLAGEPELIAAYGAALHGYEGGVLRPQLRREELRFTGKFERLELPLAVFTLLLFTLLFVQFIVLDKQIEWRDEGDIAHGFPGDMQLWLEASNQRLFQDPKNPRAVRLPNPPPQLAKTAADFQAGLDETRTKFEEITFLSRSIKEEIRKISTRLGQVSEIKQPQSALEATTLVMDQMSKRGAEMRFAIRAFEARYTRSQGDNKDDYVLVTMDVDFLGENSVEATHDYNEMENDFRAQAWCADFEGKSTKVIEGDKGIYVDHLTIQVNVEKAHPGEQP